MKYSLLLVILVSFSACGQTVDQNNLKVLLNQAQFDKQVIANLPSYEKIREITFSNLDTIFNYRDKRNIVNDYGNSNHLVRKQENEYHYEFFRNQTKKGILQKDTSLKSMPSNIYPSIDKIFNTLGKDKIEGFQLLRGSTYGKVKITDATISITIKVSYDRKTSSQIIHNLTWGKGFTWHLDDPQFPAKEMILQNGWIYYISIDHFGR
jgi:uncharacterized protein YabN with tetrapyrrole methylase and pyrophosphatase domain